MEDGTLSNTAENIKKFGAKKPAKANKTVQSSSDEEEAPKRKSLKPLKKKITNNKEKEQTDHELNIESDWCVQYINLALLILNLPDRLNIILFTASTDLSSHLLRLFLGWDVCPACS